MTKLEINCIPNNCTQGVRTAGSIKKFASVSLDITQIDANNPTAAPTTVNNFDLNDSRNLSNIARAALLILSINT
jgi:hypothetical protein